jgi:hypothetical protein
MFEIRPSFTQFDAWLRHVQRQDLSDYWTRFAQPRVAAEIRQTFDSEGHGKWRPLSPEYARWKARRYPGKTLLRREDNYYNAATQRDHPGNLHRATPTEMEWGVDPGFFMTIAGFPYPLAHEDDRSVFALTASQPSLEKGLIDDLNAHLGERLK